MRVQMTTLRYFKMQEVFYVEMTNTGRVFYLILSGNEAGLRTSKPY